MNSSGQRKAGPIRFLLRIFMKWLALFFPKNPTIRQTRIKDFVILVWSNEYIGRRVLLTGNFEGEELDFFPKLVQLGDTCLDVGANIGLHTINLARAVGSTGKVYAFEPVYRNSLVVKLNCELNQLPNVVVENVALSSISGQLMSSISSGNDSALTYFQENSEADNVVATVSIDDYCKTKSVKSVKFIKIDVEGAEMQVLQGAVGLLRSGGRPYVIAVELVDVFLARFGNSVGEVCEFLAELGYSPNLLVGGKLVEATVSSIDSQNVYFLRR